VVLVNGNNLNGEIMGLSRGKLDFETDDAGRLSIEWLKVVRVTSTFTYEVETAAGRCAPFEEIVSQEADVGLESPLACGVGCRALDSPGR